MPPRRSARVAAVVERETSALSPLPLAIVIYIFSLLPVDCRLRCLEVCRGWRAVLLERSLWTRLDMTAAGGVRAPNDSLNGLLRCAAARAGGALHSLCVEKYAVSAEALREVAAANAGALRQLQLHAHTPGHAGFSTPADASALLAAAPLLDVLSLNLVCNRAEVQAGRRALRNEAPFGPSLCVRHLFAALNDEDEAGVIAFAADVAANASLRALTLCALPLDSAAALDAVVDSALARQLQTVGLAHCRLFPVSAPALARLLGGGSLTALECSYMNWLLDAPSAAMLAAALRGSSTLTSLTLNGTGVFHNAAAAATTLVGALAGHPSVQTLSLTYNRVAEADQAAVGAALGALVAADAPALTHLDVFGCGLADDGLRALFQALQHNTHLLELDCSHNDISDAFARDVLLPAVRANTSLRKLGARFMADSAVEAEALVRARSAE
jgi:hypothetical protein